MSDFLGLCYKKILKPILFTKDAESVHNNFTHFGEFLGAHHLSRALTNRILCFQDDRLSKRVNGIKFSNPIGLAAGFDYDGRLARIMPHVGFGFNTVGTVTAKPYQGNTPPRMLRLPNSQALLVNKGFKSAGVHEVAKRLVSLRLGEGILGVSVGSSNIPEVNTIPKAIDDYLESFQILKNIENIKYFELNISCPNTQMPESFTQAKNYELLVKQVRLLDITKPIFVKMPNELSLEQADELVKLSLENGINSFIFANLVKNRSNSALNRKEIENVNQFKGNFSGRPTHEGALRSIIFFRQKYQNNIVIIGCGGVFSPQDALTMFQSGADLVQLVTGMIYEGPTLIKNINKYLQSQSVR